MIATIRRKLPRGLLFVGCNAFAALFIVIFVIGPTFSRVSTRSEEIADNVSLLFRFGNIRRDAKALVAKSLPGSDPFLAANEDRLASADLQASLKAVGETVGVRLLGIRGVQGDNVPQLRLVAVNVELEGGASAIRDFVATVESQSPMLFISAASLRSLTDGDDALIRADLKIQGAMRRQETHSGGAEARSQ
jgi:hypothetical protein